MPIPFLIPAAVAGAGALLGSGINAASNANANAKNNAFSREMYDKQKADSINFWNMENEYNSPQEQMKRLQAAGLNPNLVYGNGSAVNTSSSIPTPSAPSSSYKPNNFDLGGAVSTGFSTYVDTQLKSAQLDNLKAQNTQIANDAILKAAQTMSTLETGKNTSFKTNFLQDTAHITRAFMSEQANKMHYDQYMSQSAATRADDTNDLKLEQLRLGNKGSNLDNVLKTLTQDLQKNGINPNDPIYFRVLGRMLSNFKIPKF